MWPLYAAALIAAELGAAVGLSRFLRRRDDDLCALADVVTAALAEEKARDRFEHTLELLDAAETRMAEFGDEDLGEWGIELLHTDDADIAADYDGLLYAAAWLRLTSMPEPTDLGDL